MSPIARSCNCASGGCACRIVGGVGIVVQGAGTPSDPIVVASSFENLQGLMYVQTTPTAEMILTGSGNNEDPFIIATNVKLSLEELENVTPGESPVTGDVPVYNGTTGTWDLAPPPTTPPGAVNVGPGLVGDGSAPAPLRVAVSDTTSTTLTGLATYIDSDGELRALPYAWNDIPDKPAYYPTRWSLVIEKPTTFPPIIGTTSTTAAAGNHKHSTSDITSGDWLRGIDIGTTIHAKIPLADPSFLLTNSTGSVVYFDAAPNRTLVKDALVVGTIGSSSAVNILSNGTIQTNGTSITPSTKDFNGLVIADSLEVGNGRWSVPTSGTVGTSASMEVMGGLDVGNGLDVTGNITGSARLTVAGQIAFADVYTRASSGRDVIVNSFGTLGTSTSSERYKKNIRVLEPDALSAIRLLEPVEYERIETDETEAGFIAEDIERLGLEHLLWRDEQGRPDGLDYKRVSVYQQAWLLDLERRVREIETLIDTALSGENGDL